MQCQSAPLLRTYVFQEEFIELAQQLCARSCARVAIHKFVGVVGGELDRFPLKKEAGSRAVSCCIMVSVLLPRIAFPTLQVSYPEPPRIYCAAPVFAVTGEHLISKIVDYKVATALLKRIIPVSCNAHVHIRALLRTCSQLMRAHTETQVKLHAAVLKIENCESCPTSLARCTKA
jgi:hypothetical protein